MPPLSPPTPTRAQRDTAAAVTRWYVSRYYGRPEDSGTVTAFCDPAQVGAFAVDRAALARGEGAALFRLLVATVMFQRRQDQQIFRVLRGMSEEDANELTDAKRLLALADDATCELLKEHRALLEDCDLAKDPETRRGCCARHPTRPCHLKRHTELMKRYGHFGKVPTSAALNLRHHKVNDLAELYEMSKRAAKSKLARARWLEEALAGSWRVSRKIANMYLSAVSNPDLSGDLSPWAEGLDWRYFIVIDSNVDLFLSAVGYDGPGTYDARREFVRELARRIDLRRLNPDLRKFNPRLVQQALYLFMSVTNRRARPQDCMHMRPLSCGQCSSTLRACCPVISS